jgi:chemotaxis protein methyltransferase CheR
MQPATRLAQLVEDRIGMQAVLSSQRIETLLDAVAPADRGEWVDGLSRCAAHDPRWLSVANTLLNHETFFFRHPRQLRHLADDVLPELVRRRLQRGEHRFRAWSVGCSSGEEVHTVALLLRAAIAAAGGPAFDRWDVEVLGSDVSARVLESARASDYRVTPGLNSFRDIPAWARPWFDGVLVGGDGRWTPDPELARRVRFVEHNLVKDAAPLGDADLVLCRNVLIYFTEAQSRTAVATLGRALTPGGVLLLGPADGLREVTGFEKVCRPGTVFWRKQGSR